MRHRCLIMACIAVACLWAGGSLASAGTLTWQTSKADAVSLALEQGKKILLVAGRDGCSHCHEMKFTVCESLSPPIRSLIDRYYVPWYCNIDDDKYKGEYLPYRPSGLFTLPLICVIDPNDSDHFLDRTTNTQDLQVFYSRLNNLKSPMVDLADAITSLKILAHIPTSAVAINDINGDQKIGVAEAIYFLQKAAGLR
jgi:hypothetical protein